MAVLNKSRSGIPPGAIYIGRGSKWGNPFPINRTDTRHDVIRKHREHLHQQILNREVTLEELAALKGKDLVCFCAPLQCHGHTLEKAADWASNELAGETQ